MEEKYYLGIDVGKFEHQATLVNERREMMGQSIRFKNNTDSFLALMEQIRKDLPEQAEIKAGMESTGHYWINLNNFLKDSGIKDVQIINPIETKSASNMTTTVVVESKPFLQKFFIPY